MAVTRTISRRRAALLETLEPGDTVIVFRLDCLAVSGVDLIATTARIRSRNAVLLTTVRNNPNSIPNLLKCSLAVVYIDPFGVIGLETAAFNPFDRIYPYGLDLAGDCTIVAYALVHDVSSEAGDAHWNKEIKALIAGILPHIVTTEPPAACTLADPARCPPAPRAIRSCAKARASGPLRLCRGR